MYCLGWMAGNTKGNVRENRFQPFLGKAASSRWFGVWLTIKDVSAGVGICPENAVLNNIIGL